MMVNSMCTKISVLGHFALNDIFLDGQTIKTKNITEELQNQLGKEQVLIVDTHGRIKTILKAPFQVLKALINSKNVLIFPAQNGLRVYAPLLVMLRPLFNKKKLHYIVIGGWLPHFLKRRKFLSRILKRFDAIYVETNIMKKAMQAQGFENICVLPNCKKLPILSQGELAYPQGGPYRLCTFSRVMKEKGIEDAVNAVIQVNKSLGFQAFSLDVYGQVDKMQSEWFAELQNRFPEYIRYCGLVPFDKSVDILKEYFALLFPTYYEGEGFAGTLIDAFSAGVPVIATDWKYNSEIVNSNTGFIYPTGDQEAFIDILTNVANNPSMVLDKKRFCIEEAQKFQIEKVVRDLVGNI